MAEIGIEPSMIKVDMELLYNGYLFHQDGEHRVYNPSMMLYLFAQILRYSTLKGSIIDDNLKTDYGRLRRLLQRDNNRDQLMQIVQDNSILSNVIAKFPIDDIHENKYFTSLLFYMGLLTIDKIEEGLLRLKIPNYSIRTIFWEYIERLTIDNNADVLIDMSEQRIALRELAYRGNPQLFIDCVSKNIFTRLSNRDLQNFNEKYVKIMLLNGLFQSKLYIPITEMEVSRGYTDIYLQRSHDRPEIPYEWVWEIKYIKKEDADKVLDEKRDEVRIQLRKYRDSHLIADRTDVRYLSLIFIGKD
jgi:hypothetical protein